MVNHDSKGGSLRGKAALYGFEVDGLAFCHLEDLDEVIDVELVQQLRPIDVLMVPIGGVFIMDHESADAMVRMLQLKVVVPMHYRNKYVTYALETVVKFINAKENFKLEKTNRITLAKDSLPQTTQILLLDLPQA